jgi:hypothetical protein
MKPDTGNVRLLNVMVIKLVEVTEAAVIAEAN